MADGQTIEEMLAQQEREDDAKFEAASSGWWDAPVLLVFAALFTTVLLQFFTRYVLNDSLSWTEEAARYLLILLTFVGIIKCQVLDSHIRLEFIDGFLPGWVKPLKLISLVLMIGFFTFLTWALWVLADTTSFQKMVSLPFPKWYLYTLLIAALIALLVVQVRQLWRLLRGEDTA